MISKSTADIINLLEEQGEEHNTLQRVLLEFLKEELPHMLSVSVDTENAGFYEAEGKRVKVALKLGEEVISSDYFYVP